ncbi:hypothetical protein QUF56_12165 [Ureibacillus composti]|nr:hypothetical protein [Ureibacillus composti]
MEKLVTIEIIEYKNGATGNCDYCKKEKTVFTKTENDKLICGECKDKKDSWKVI